MKTRHTSDYRRLLQLLRQARADSGLTQEEVARTLGKPQSYVSKCESGERRIDPIELADFARIYDVSVLDFYAKRSHLPSEEALRRQKGRAE